MLPACTVAQWFLDTHQDIDLKHLDDLTRLVERARNDTRTAAQAVREPNREVIHQAAKNGNLQYWRDSEAQRVAFNEWRAGGYVGDCPQIAKGSIVDYITDAVVAAIAAPVQSCSAGTAAPRFTVRSNAIVDLRDRRTIAHFYLWNGSTEEVRQIVEGTGIPVEPQASAGTAREDSTCYVERSMVRIGVMGTGNEALLKWVDDLPIFTAEDFRSGPQSLWQPIETAPQDGTRILATGGGLGKEVEAVTYNERVGCWSAETCTLDDTDHEPDGYSRPTHWQPMPDTSALSRPHGGGVA